MDGLGTYLAVYDDNGDCAHVVADDQQSLDAAVSHYAEYGRDRLLHLELVCGDAWNIKASKVRDWVISTPGGRARLLELVQAADEESRATKQSLGIWDDGE